eukprot:COSAG02_NODE_10409_length_1946_cov_17.110991_2_plen_21_part_01
MCIANALFLDCNIERRLPVVI